MLSVRLVKVDHYMTAPLPTLDVLYSEFRGSEVKHVPVIRIFGPTPSGEKACVHVHGVFPYFYVPYDASEPCERLMYQLSSALDKALNISLGKGNSSNQHVFKVALVSGIPFYGYHSKEHQFLKIYLYNPLLIKKASEVLQNGVILDKVFQPHEVHIPYALQFMIDYNLFGMSYANFERVKFRQVIDTEDNENAVHIPEELLLPAEIVRISTCQHEVDVIDSDILNRKLISGGGVSAAVNPGLAGIWEDEKQRRREEGRSSQITPQLSQSRPLLIPTDSELFYKQRLKERLVSLQSQATLTESHRSDEKDASYPAETPPAKHLINASFIDDHVATAASRSPELNNSLLFDDVPVVNEDLMLNMSSSSPAASPFSSQFDSQDQQLVQLLQALDADDGRDVDDDSILGSQILKMGNVEDEEECDYDLTQPLHLENVDLEVSGIKSSSCGTETLPQSSADVWESSYWDSADSEIPQLDGANDDSDADDQGPLKYNSKPLSGNPGMESFSSSYSICNGNYKYGTFGTTYECFETVCNDSSLQSVLPFGEYYSGDSQTIYSLQHSSIMNTPESETMDIPDLADLSQFCENSPHELPFGVDDCSLCDNIGVDNSQNELDNTDLRDISDCSELQIDKYLSDIDPPCLHDRFSKVLMGDPPFFAKDFSDKDSDINKNNLDSVLDKSLDRVDDNFLEFLPYMTPNDDVNDTRDEFNIDNLESADSNVIPFTDDSAFQVKSEDVFPLEEKPDIDFMNEAFTIESSIPPIFEMAPLSDSEIEKPVFPALDVNIQLPTRESVKRGRRKYSKSAVQKGTVTCSKRKVITDKSSTSYLLRQKDKKSECEASAGRRGNRRKKDEAITKPSDTLFTTCSLNLADVDSGRSCVNSKRTKIPSAKTDRKSSFNTFASVTYEPQILCDASTCSTSADFDDPVTERRKRKLEHFDDVNETSSLHTNKRSKKSTKVHEVTCYSNSKSSNYSNTSTESRATNKTCSDEYDPYAFSDDVDSDIPLCTVPSSSKGTFVVSKDKNFKRYSRRCYENKGKSNRRGAATSLTMLQNNTQNNCSDGLIDELNKFVNSVPNSSVESNLELRTPLHEYFNKCSSQPRVVIKRYASVANLRVVSGRSKNEFPDDRSDVHRRRQMCHARKSQCSSDNNSDESIEMKSYKKFPSSQSEESMDMVHVPKLKIKRVSSNEYVSISQDSALVSSVSTRSEENISVDCVLRVDPLRENRASVMPSLKSLCSNICSRFTNNNEPLTAVNSEVIKCCGSTEQIAESTMNEFSVHCEHNNRFVNRTTDIEKSNSFVTDTDGDYQITTGTENVSKVKRCIIKGKTNIPESGHVVARSNSCNFNDRVNTKSSRTFSRSVSQASSKEVEESDSYDSYWPRVPSARRVLRTRGFSMPVGRSLRPRKKVNYSESSIKESRTDIHSLKCSKEVLSLLKPLSIKVKPLTISELRKYNITIPNKDPLIKDAKTQGCTYVSSDLPCLFEPGSSASSVYKKIPCVDGAVDSSSSDEESFSDSSILSCKSGKTNNNNRVKNLKHDNHSSRARVSDDSSKATSPKFNFESTKKLIRSPTKSLLKVKICSSPKSLSPKNKSDVLTSQPEKKRHELKDTSVMENKNLQKGKLKRIEVDSSECRQSYETKYSKLKSALSSEESAVSRLTESSRGHAEHTNG